MFLCSLDESVSLVSEERGRKKEAKTAQEDHVTCTSVIKRSTITLDREKNKWLNISLAISVYEMSRRDRRTLSYPFSFKCASFWCRNFTLSATWHNSTVHRIHLTLCLNISILFIEWKQNVPRDAREWVQANEREDKTKAKVTRSHDNERQTYLQSSHYCCKSRQ